MKIKSNKYNYFHKNLNWNPNKFNNINHSITKKTNLTLMQLIVLCLHHIVLTNRKEQKLSILMNLVLVQKKIKKIIIKTLILNNIFKMFQMMTVLSDYQKISI